MKVFVIGGVFLVIGLFGGAMVSFNSSTTSDPSAESSNRFDRDEVLNAASRLGGVDAGLSNQVVDGQEYDSSYAARENQMHSRSRLEQRRRRMFDRSNYESTRSSEANRVNSTTGQLQHN